jgi:hypothetical protein
MAVALHELDEEGESHDLPGLGDYEERHTL